MLSYKTIFDGWAIHTPLTHKSNNIYIFTWLKHLKLVKAYVDLSNISDQKYIEIKTESVNGQERLLYPFMHSKIDMPPGESIKPWIDWNVCWYRTLIIMIIIDKRLLQSLYW